METKPTCRTYKNGHKSWVLPNGQLHREDGPAVIYPDGYSFLYLGNRCYSEKAYSEKIKELAQDKEFATI